MPATKSATKAKATTSTRPKRASASSGKVKQPIVIDSDSDENVVASELELDSDHLDSDEDSGANDKRGQKRKRASNTKDNNAKGPSPKKRKSTSGLASPHKRAKKAKDEEESDFEDNGSDSAGERVVGRVVQAPTKGRVPPGQVSQNTLSFLADLKKPECNDREWFRLHEPVYRLAEKEWNDFVTAFTEKLMVVDDEIPPLPPKDVTHRIYRDVRFSPDKTPYKTGLSATFSRTGRKGSFACYHICIRPGGGSMLAAGLWQPSKDALQLIRTHIQHHPERLRRVIGATEFVNLFGEAKPHPKGERRSIFGSEDELKVAPKGVAKTHAHIDLLKLRSFAVHCRFPDADVLKPDFAQKLADVARVVRPFVHRLNEMSTIPPEDDEDEEDDEDADNGDDDQ